ncbi:hypothetical protein AB4Y64_07625 [Lysobacter sp. TAF61]|uniref:hypothetical protein n=1 Tax=Lysobacter sp. TAF61 TaxID=3233072 RepID=UPI003F9D30FA
MSARMRGEVQSQQQGYWDDEVTLASHDRICAWAYDNSLQIAKAVYPYQFGRAWHDEDVDRSHAWALERERERYKFDSQRLRVQPRPSPRTRVHWEVPLFASDDRKRQLGFADLVIKVLLPRIRAEWASDSHGRNDSYMGCEVTWESEVWAPSILVEAKADLPTMGELMRQLNHYRQGFDGMCVVVAADDSLSSLLSSQGVQFVRYPGRMIPTLGAVVTNKAKIDAHLAALDSELVMMRAQHRSPQQMLARFNTMAVRIRAEAGTHRDYVSSRLLAIYTANRLGPTESHPHDDTH